MVLCVLQADLTSVRAATRAATCHLKMGQLAEASQILDTVQALVTASGQAPPPELVSKQNDLDVTKRLVSQVVSTTSVSNRHLSSKHNSSKGNGITLLTMFIIIFTGMATMVRSC